MCCRLLVLFGGQQVVSGSQTVINATETDAPLPGAEMSGLAICPIKSKTAVNVNVDVNAHQK